MKTLEELGGYYNAVLMPELRVIEEKRKKVLKKVFLWGGSICGLFCLILVGLILLGLGFQFIIFAVVGLAAALGLTFRLLTANYTGEFKTKIIKKIVSFIDEGLSYSKDGCIPRADFILSKIFHRRPDRYRGDDYVSGMIDKTKLRFSEVYAEYETRDSKGNRHWHKLFKGLFFIADFNKDFKGTTVVLPDTAERLLGGLGSFFQKMNVVRGQLIKLEDPEFEKLFAVYGDDQIEARYILSTSLMKRIVDFKKKTGRQIYLSFVGSLIFVAVSFRKNLFEPNVFKTVLDFGQISEYYQDLELAIGVVEDLNLNTRIWSKQ
ncbi:MAG: DUF3137 domain-containing protein [Candidatus Omnitrophica bacterium]|nr:DUF3137 domain-containing protein [Candidatus Omnitrophota bacterium]